MVLGSYPLLRQMGVAGVLLEFLKDKGPMRWGSGIWGLEFEVFRPHVLKVQQLGGHYQYSGPRFLVVLWLRVFEVAPKITLVGIVGFYTTWVGDS